MALKLLLAGALALAIKKRGMEEAENDVPFVASRLDGKELQPAPIEPSWVLAGDPQARCVEHHASADGDSITAVWDCTAGTFRWRFGWDETVVILEGEVHVTAQDGTERRLVAGDMAYFRAGSEADWHVENYVRKVAFLRRPMPALVSMAIRMKQALRGG